jgi:hypothetical protein
MSETEYFIAKFIGYNSYKGFRQGKVYKISKIYNAEYLNVPYVKVFTDDPDIHMRDIPAYEFKILSNTEQFLREDE